jgi:hypothetical protein
MRFQLDQPRRTGTINSTIRITIPITLIITTPASAPNADCCQDRIEVQKIELKKIGQSDFRAPTRFAFAYSPPLRGAAVDTPNLRSFSLACRASFVFG